MAAATVLVVLQRAFLVMRWIARFPGIVMMPGMFLFMHGHEHFARIGRGSARVQAGENAEQHEACEEPSDHGADFCHGTRRLQDISRLRVLQPLPPQP